MDEFPEFGSRVLEVMRQPMEDKVVTSCLFALFYNNMNLVMSRYSNHVV